jgi:beta-phosphoglucomutase-like phosphatase (HAD superfamily)
MLAIFDNDGTICDTQDVEGRCYVLAIEHVTGMSLSTQDWTTYDEPTSSGIVRQLLAGDAAAKEKEEWIKSEFCRLLQEERPRSPGDFLPIQGAVEFISRLTAEKICAVAIATGCFDTTARFKLQCCGLALERFPHATSSDACRRNDIIPLAAARAGFDLSSVVYFGDAPWDVRVCATLGVPMIGIGRRHNLLRTLGVRHAFRDYTNPDQIIDAMLELRPPGGRYEHPFHEQSRF